MELTNSLEMEINGWTEDDFSTPHFNESEKAAISTWTKTDFYEVGIPGMGQQGGF